MKKPAHNDPHPLGSEEDETADAIIDYTISPDAIEIMKRFREKYFPDSLLETQDQYAKWLLGLTTTVAALGAGFSNAAFTTLKGAGLWAYGLAVLFAGLGIAISTFSLSVSLPNVNWNSLDEMLKGTEKPLRTKRRSILLSAVALALALALAGMAPILSLVKVDGRGRNPSLTYSIVKDSVQCAFSSAALMKGSRFGVSILGIGPDDKEMLLGSASDVADSRGKSSVAASRSDVPADLVSLKFVGIYTLGAAGAREQTEEIKVALKPAAKGTTPK